MQAPDTTHADRNALLSQKRRLGRRWDLRYGAVEPTAVRLPIEAERGTANEVRLRLEPYMGLMNSFLWRIFRAQRFHSPTVMLDPHWSNGRDF